jgi:DNA/RNA endonuclease G (NUC1)
LNDFDFLVNGNHPSTYLFDVVCKSGTFRHFDNPPQLINLQSFSCNLKNQPSLQWIVDTDRFCPTGVERYQLGFTIPSVLHSFVLFAELCYDRRSGSTVLARHTIYGKTISNRMPSTNANFRIDNLNQDLQKLISHAYKKVNQTRRFPRRHIGTGEQYYAKGHLVPDSDGITKSQRDATYFYMNTVPQWQKINNGIWKRIENSIRALADQFANNLQVYTGTSGNQGRLADGGVEIPLWMFKVVIRPALNGNPRAGIVLLTLNDINATHMPSTSQSCVDICDNNNWLIGSDPKDFKKGYTKCCAVDDFQRNFLDLRIDTTNMIVLRGALDASQGRPSWPLIRP